MTVTQPIKRVVDLLTAAGYRPLQGRIVIASLSFEFAAVLIGANRSPDLIAVIDTVTDKEDRIRQKVEGLTRALDLVQSRRPLTVVLVGPIPRAALLEVLARVCRVLAVGTPTGVFAERTLADALAVLLPLELPLTSETGVDPLQEVRSRLSFGRDMHRDASIEDLLAASLQGPDAVREKLRCQLQATLLADEGEQP